MRLINFSWLRPGRVAGMAYPPPGAVEALRAEGVAAVLSLTERAPETELADAGLETGHVPLVDFGTPTLADLGRCVAWIEAQLEAGRGVAVHCHAGMGRTGTVLAAWLVAGGLDAEAALAEVRRRRPGSVETDGQADAVRAFAATRDGGA